MRDGHTPDQSYGDLPVIVERRHADVGARTNEHPAIVFAPLHARVVGDQAEAARPNWPAADAHGPGDDGVQSIGAHDEFGCKLFSCWTYNATCPFVLDPDITDSIVFAHLHPTFARLIKKCRIEDEARHR